MKTSFILLLSIIICSTAFGQMQDCTPVVELKALYENDKAFSSTIDRMFENVQPLEDGSQNPWAGKDVVDLYEFINEWFYFLPDTHNALDRILEFTFLYYENPAGMEFILGDQGRNWTISFVEERGKYLDSPESTQIIEKWLNDPALNNDEFVYPKEGFDSFNDFFIRDLKPGSRPIEGVTDQSALVSPADGIINMIYNELSLVSEIPTKSGMK